MSDWLELAIRYLGIAMLSTICLALIAGTLLCVAIVVVRFTPRVHLGRPQNDGELSFYDPRVIGDRRLITDPLKIKWWVGLSRRTSSKWFFGFIRWEPKRDA